MGSLSGVEACKEHAVAAKYPNIQWFKIWANFPNRCFRDGKLSEPNDRYADIDIPSDLLITNFDDPTQAIVQSTYPILVKNCKDPKNLQSRALLAGTLEIVNAINEYIFDLIPSNTMFQHVFRIVWYNYMINCSFLFYFYVL